MAASLDFGSVLLDVDGTLLNSNHAHAEAWAQALQEHGVTVETWQVRPLIGMGGDKLLPTVAKLDEHSEDGRAVARRKRELFAAHLPHLRPTRGARALVAFLRGEGIEVVVATSADQEEVQALLAAAGVEDLVRRRVSKHGGVDSKPDPDIVCAALDAVEADRASAVMVGDTPYDIEAASRAGVGTIALRCGGYWTDEAFRGALRVFDDPQDLLDTWRLDARGSRGLD